MDRQAQHKLIHTTHQRDELVTKMQNLADTLEEEEIIEIVNNIKRLNKIIKKLNKDE